MNKEKEATKKITLKTLSKWCNLAEDHEKEFLNTFVQATIEDDFPLKLTSISFDNENMYFSFITWDGQHLKCDRRIEEWFRFLDTYSEAYSEVYSETYSETYSEAYSEAYSETYSVTEKPLTRIVAFSRYDPSLPRAQERMFRIADIISEFNANMKDSRYSESRCSESRCSESRCSESRCSESRCSESRYFDVALKILSKGDKDVLKKRVRKNLLTDSGIDRLRNLFTIAVVITVRDDIGSYYYKAAKEQMDKLEEYLCSWRTLKILDIDAFSCLVFVSEHRDILDNYDVPFELMRVKENYQ